MTHDNETCEGCIYFALRDNPSWAKAVSEPWCSKQKKHWSYEAPWPDSDYSCDMYAPSLECRKVRALERIATLLEKFDKPNP
jgi:hypothetical protein